MKRIFVIWLLLFASAGQAADWNKDPETLVRSFEQENATFHEMAYPIADIPKYEPQIMEAWNKIREKYFMPGFKGSPKAYISATVNRTLEKKIELKSASKPKAIVVVTEKVRNTVLNTEGTSIIEYDLTWESGRWYIANVYTFYKGKKYDLYE